MAATSPLFGCSSAIAQRCAQMEWSAPATIGTATAYGGYVEIPEILASADGIAFIGSPAVTWEKDLAKNTRVAGFRRNTDGTFTPIPVPPSYERMAAPRATIGADGTLHVLWVPPDSAGWPDRSEQSQVLSSRFVDGAWTTPRTVFRDGKDLNWGFSSMGGVVTQGVDRELIVRWLRPKSSITRFRLVDSIWRASTIKGPWNFDPRLALPRKGVAVIGFLDWVDNGAGTQGLFVSRSLDDEATWSPPVRISQPASETAYDPVLFTIPDGRLIAAWTVGDKEGTRIAIAASTSADTGRTWTAPSLMAPHGELTSMRATAARDGSIWVVVQHLIGGKQHPAVYAWDGRWNPAWTPPADEAGSFSQPTIAAMGPRIIVTWSSVFPTAIQGQRIPTTRFVIGQPHC